MRPGEKLYEELLLGENPQPTLHAKINKAQDPFIPWHQLESDLNALNMQLTKNNVKEIMYLLQKLVPGYHPSSDLVDWLYRENNKSCDSSKGAELS